MISDNHPYVTATVVAVSPNPLPPQATAVRAPGTSR